ncbi:MAG: PEP-CTERM sorting domain-containing protein [Rubrivivax sp.]|nr:MAG: PEP-CTERM sorting domain-containing protein [Rubrivivax sp.]
MPQFAAAASCVLSSGNYSATCPTTLNAGDSVTVVPGGYKYLNVTVNAHSGSVIDATDHLYFTGGNTLNNAGSYRFGNDASLYNDGVTGVFVNTGTLSKIGGTGDSHVNISGFNSNGGTVNVQTGRIVFDNGGAFNAGSSFTGSGQTLITNGANFSGSFSSDGSLVLAGGTHTGSSGTPANFASGVLQWTAGSLAGNWQTASGTTVNLSGGSYKYMSGAVTHGGTVVATDHLYFDPGAGRVLTNNGSYQFASDAGLYDNGGAGVFINNGTLAKTGGTGDSHVSISGFGNGGTGVVNVQSGRIVFDNGAAFASGSRIAGAGQAVITAGATISGNLRTANNLYLSGGIVTANDVVATGDVYWTSGTLDGSWQTASGSALYVAGGSYKYVGGTLANAGTMTASDHLYFNPGTTVVNNGVYQFANDAGLYNNGGAGSFINSGMLAKVGGTGDSHVSISGFSNGATGVIDVQTGRLVFDNGASFAGGTRIQGAGSVTVTAGATFGGNLATANNLYLSGGAVTANNVVASGDVHWTSGTLGGSWQTASGSALNIVGGSYKYVGGTLTNAGTMNASDHLYFNPGTAIVNNGRFQFANDAGLYNNGGTGSFANNGTLAKMGGTGDSHVSISGFSNNPGGAIDVQAGRIVFDNGVILNGGSTLSGSGSILVTNGASIAGNLATANNLYFSGGTATASHVVASGGAHWTSGTMSGQWQSAAGSALSIEGGSYKYAAGLKLAGRSVATDHVYAYGSDALANDGRYEFANDSGIYGGGDVVNNGRIVKAGGTGTSDLSNTALLNLGTLESQTGALRLPDNFTNAGTIQGGATVQVNGTLTNNGHLMPGSDAAVGTLTLAGGLSQSAGGTLDIRLASASLSDMLLVTGSAAIGGSTLALSCFSCALNAGDAFLLLDSSGALTGTFGGVTTSGFGSGFAYAIDYTHTNQVWLSVTNVGAVPEPSSYAMLLAGVAILGWLARRRRR